MDSKSFLLHQFLSSGCMEAVSQKFKKCLSFLTLLNYQEVLSADHHFCDLIFVILGSEASLVLYLSIFIDSHRVDAFIVISVHEVKGDKRSN